jgi:hypothetical protein
MKTTSHNLREEERSENITLSEEHKGDYDLMPTRFHG